MELGATPDARPQTDGGVRRAGLLRTGSIVARSVAATLAITIPTIVEVRRGTYERATGDERLRWWSKRLLDIVEMEVAVRNPHGVTIERGRPTILMSNHTSLYDIPLTFVAVPGTIRMLTKKELFRVPVWGRGLEAGEFISIDRRNREQALRDLDRAREKMESGVTVWIAPEGTRSRSGVLGPFKKGGFMLALQTGATIIPVGIRGARDVLPARTLRFRLGCRAEVHIGRPIEAAAYGLPGRERLMEDVAHAIAELADCPRDGGYGPGASP